MTRSIKQEDLQGFKKHLLEEEKSDSTIEKYMRDVNKFVNFIGNRYIDKTAAMEYKAMLAEEYKVRSANSMIASLNAFFKFAGWHDCCIKQFKVQSQSFYPEEKALTRAEYLRLVKAAQKSGNERLQMIIQTICSTGIRISELKYITVDAVKRGEAYVNCKGKSRCIIIVNGLRKKLRQYIKKNNIAEGPVFVTRNRNPVDRCNIWREMKALCGEAKVLASKVFPHNLRHLFARTFYDMEKNIAELADVLGHESINTTRIYVATTIAEHRKKLECLKLLL